MPRFNRDRLFSGLRALAKKLRRSRSASTKGRSPSSAPRSDADHSTSSSSSSSSTSSAASSHGADIRRVFAEYDRDGDGRISLADLTHMVRAIGGDDHPAADAAAEAATMMEVADADRDGYIGFDEFQALMATPTTPTAQQGTAGSVLPQDGNAADELTPRQGPCSWPDARPGGDDDDEEDLRLAFAVYDRDGDGVITAQEIHAVLRRVMEAGITLADCTRMVQAVDRDGDGVVGFHDFATMMRTAQPCAFH